MASSILDVMIRSVQLEVNVGEVAEAVILLGDGT